MFTNTPYTAQTGANGYKISTTPSYTSGTGSQPYAGSSIPPNPYATSAGTTGFGSTSNPVSYSNMQGLTNPLGNTPNTNLYTSPSSLSPAPAQTQKQVAGKQISNTQAEDEEGAVNFHALVEKRERENNRDVYEGEPYDCLKHLTQQQIDDYAKRGITDYLNCLRLSTKQELHSKYDRTLKTCEVQGVQDFKDDEFPPELTSLVGSNQAGRTSWKGLKWLRPRDIKGYTNFALFQDAIEPNDIKQGYLGDCYFLSSIASLAEWPDRIRNLFSLDKPNPYGCHCVKICDKGEWREVIVDQFFPCVSAARGPSFTKGNGAEIWVMLLEKAWAKINGSYDQIEAGLTRECLHDFTGACTQTLWLDDQNTYDSVWQKLLIGEKNNYAMTCGSTDVASKEELDKLGLINGHAYSLLGAYEVTSQGRVTRLVKLRNPWGEREWTGDWNDSDTKLHQLNPDDKRAIGMHERAENDGIFFMSYDDFRKYFTDAQICYVHDDFEYASIRAQSAAKQAKFFKVKIPQRGRYFFAINQKSKRKYPKDQQKEFKYSTATLLVAKQESDGTFKYIEGQQREDREVWTGESEDQIYEAGTYIVYAKVQWRNNDFDEFVLSAYGSSKVTFTEITKVEAQNVISEAYFDHANRLSKRQKKLLADNKSWILLDQTDDGFFYLAINNKSDKILNGEFKFTKMGGLKLKNPFNGQSVKVSLSPGKHACAILRVKDYKQLTALSLSQTIQFK
ncbi:calpain family cysteine protease (macronuclear) [Tetrahymena thermophila SB210]|uniref:Calpain family cysteine protease n=1 Tax=Tetrahymena thermophila (strain SB210) TaxID=312017 RepID=I7MCL9_TETTS|nr:calpain family cysteine protease [Tetrahymena thermophila SB210]EAR84269.2 calpain family cysteine protease [Tetrahymena thermophila SB210]|eukprot:XP_001031932.2 calpain family cysteine protease [Tetrahymena thermophila SB210]